jgi:hypothetical protein
MVPSFGAPSFASPVSQRVVRADGTIEQAVARCYPTDLCVLILYRNGDRLSIYSEGHAYCEPYFLHFDRTNGGRTLYAFSRRLDYDAHAGALGCGRSKTTRIVMDGGRVSLAISTNPDGTLRFHFSNR